jgi:hypothetical protein
MYEIDYENEIKHLLSKLKFIDKDDKEKNGIIFLLNKQCKMRKIRKSLKLNHSMFLIIIKEYIIPTNDIINETNKIIAKK